MSKAIVVLSGGQDSTTCLFWAVREFDEVHAITFDYGQRHRVEIDAASTVSAMAGVSSHVVVQVPDCLISTSPLTSDTDLETYESDKQMEKIIGGRRELTFVPMRNAFFLTIAANRAEAMGIKNLVTGVCEMDTANYDDCRQVFIDATEVYINTALGHDHRGTGPIKVHTPLLQMDKAASIKFARSLPGCWDALAYTHTCYAGQVPPCGECHSCVLRAQGFALAGYDDPLIQRTRGA